ncbi:MAG: ABC transporter ATP-binding protein [Clostridiales bacterium]|nr:ABC transporter ATP-binding protein [Clostridiales bacterium]
MKEVLKLENVTRNYQTTIGVIRKKKETVEAVKPLNFSIYEGEIFGLLGPNGAGKTTTIKMMTTLLTPSSGVLSILGYDCVHDYKKIRPRINFIFGGERNLYWRLSAIENLIFFADLYLVPKEKQKKLIPKVLERVGLSDVKDRKIETFSKGMKQRLLIAKALLNEPEILFLDEPTIGLDPVGARELRTIIREIASNKTTVVLTTHYMPEAEELCDRIAIIDKGSIIALDDVTGLRNLIYEPAKLRFPSSNLNDSECHSIKSYDLVKKIYKIEKSNFIDIYTHEIDQVLNQIIKDYGKEKVKGMQIQDVNLEDVYVELVGGSHAV